MSEASGKMSMGSGESTEDEYEEDMETQAAVESRFAERTILDSFDAEKSAPESLEDDIPWRDRFAEVVLTYAFLGFVSFGGPQAHVSILRDHLVARRKWLDDEQFTELFAIGQGLPGPTSTQLVLSTAMARAGPIGGLAAVFLWNLPILIILITCGVLIATLEPDNPPWYLVGLPPAAISLLCNAFYGFGKKLDRLGVILCLISSLVAILTNGDQGMAPTSSQYVFPIMLALGGFVAYSDSRRQNPYGTYKSASKGWDVESDLTMKRIGIPVWVGALIIVVWATVLASTVSVVSKARVEGREVNASLETFEVMYRIGSLVFGGEHVVLPMLQTEIVPAWMTKDQFLQGLGLVQSMPGPLLSYSSYLGAVYNGVGGGVVAYLGLFGPGVILIFGVVPFWARLRHVKWFKSALNGVNAAAIGLMGASCVILWVGAVTTAADAMVFVLAGTLAYVYGIAAPFVILAGGIFGAILHKDALDLGQVEWCMLMQGGNL